MVELRVDALKDLRVQLEVQLLMHRNSTQSNTLEKIIILREGVWKTVAGGNRVLAGNPCLSGKS